MRGFTLLELMIVLAILGILLGWGVPSFKQMMASNRLTTNANNLVYAFQLARNEALTRAKPIDIVPATGGWKAGWSIKDGSTTIMKWDVPSSNITITETSSLTSFQYNAQGRLTSSGELTIYDCSNSSLGRKVEVSLVGRAYVSNIACP